MELNFKTADYEGPLDLLLTLIARHKIDILDINITELLSQYLAEIGNLDGADMETASSFLEMASKLVYIKTVSLLPKHEEETQQLKSELSGQLLEYQLCKEVAAMLNALYIGGDVFVREPQKLEKQAQEYIALHPVSELVSAYMSALGKKQRRLPPPKSAFSGIVKRRVVSVSSRIIHIMRRLYTENEVAVDGIMDDCTDRSELVATFLAVLELIKSGRVAVDGDDGVMKLTGQALTEGLDGIEISSEADAAGDETGEQEDTAPEEAAKITAEKLQ